MGVQSVGTDDVGVLGVACTGPECTARTCLAVIKSIFDVNLGKSQHVAKSFWPDSKLASE
jgi:hypothetical protein